MDSVSELVWRGDGVADGLRSLVDVARGSLGEVCSGVFEEVEERWSSCLFLPRARSYADILYLPD